MTTPRRVATVLGIWLQYLAPLWAADAPAPARLIACGAAEVFVLELPADSAHTPVKTWSWRAEASSEIEASHRRWFATTDDCKPYEDELLISSSSGGVALVRRTDQRCRFYTYSRNAHSACRLPEDRLAVAASTGGDEVQIFAIDSQPRQERPLTALPLAGAHGVEWDAGRNCLWALGEAELLRVEMDAAAVPPQWRVSERRPLPTDGGHDLSPAAETAGYYITTNSSVYRFDCAAGTFAPLAGMAHLAAIKSVDQHPTTGEIVYHQAAAEHWWSDTIRFRGSRPAIRLPDERLYKLRWDQPRSSP